MRADIPLGLDLLPVFWKKLASLDLDPVTDLQQADILTYKYIKRFEMVSLFCFIQRLRAFALSLHVTAGLFYAIIVVFSFRGCVNTKSTWRFIFLDFSKNCLLWLLFDCMACRKRYILLFVL
jgi:hypothetical protein